MHKSKQQNTGDTILVPAKAGSFSQEAGNIFLKK